MKKKRQPINPDRLCIISDDLGTLVIYANRRAVDVFELGWRVLSCIELRR